VDTNGDTRRRCLEHLQAVFRVVFGDDGLVLSEATSQREIPGWDRSSHLQLIAAIENRFGIRFTTREAWSSGDSTSSVALLVDLLVPKLARAAQGLRSSIAQAASASERRRLLYGFIREQLRGLVQADPVPADPKVAFHDLGLTSLGALELCSRLDLGLDLNLGPTVIFNFPNVAKLTEHLAARLGMQPGDEPTDISGGSGRLSGLLEEIGDLSEEEAAGLLGQSFSDGGTQRE
jgi:acyl carrier protein